VERGLARGSFKSDWQWMSKKLRELEGLEDGEKLFFEPKTEYYKDWLSSKSTEMEAGDDD